MERVLPSAASARKGPASEAEASRVAVREKLHTYNETVKKARTEIFTDQESQRRRTVDERQATINTARATAQTALQEAKKSLAAEVKAARTELEQSSGALADQIAEAVLAGTPSESGQFPGQRVRDEHLAALLGFLLQMLSLFIFSWRFRRLRKRAPRRTQPSRIAGLIFRWLNFLIVFGGIGYLIMASTEAHFSAPTRRKFPSSIVEATAVKAEADRELRETEAKVEHLDQDLTAMREEARRNWAAESERLRASSVAEIEKINQAARGELAASERAAQQQLRHIAAALSVERAAALVSSRMNPEIRSRMFQSLSRQAWKGCELKALAERYAGALVDVALENKQADQVKQELAAFAAMMRESAELHAFLANPSIARAAKHSAIEADRRRGWARAARCAIICL